MKRRDFLHDEQAEAALRREVASQLYISGERPGRYVKDVLASPDFEDTKKCHDWRNYIADEVQALWPTLSDTARMCVALGALIQANAEEWD